MADDLYGIASIAALLYLLFMVAYLMGIKEGGEPNKR